MVEGVSNVDLGPRRDLLVRVIAPEGGDDLSGRVGREVEPDAVITDAPLPALLIVDDGELAVEVVLTTGADIPDQSRSARFRTRSR